MAECLAGVGDEFAQQRKLGGSEANHVAAPADRSVLEIDQQIARHETGRRGGCRRDPRAPQRGEDARQQLVDAERFRHVVVGAQVQRAHLVALAAARR
ncbi:MAG: hypothetical protein E6G39_11660 [Actinobacteria bacterium]|nr:MAG: hypothetical protein E6G39_11660 [Actinomycetota bacterium]